MSTPIKKQFDYYVTNLNWGDGTPLEYVEKPKLFDRSFNFEHNYDRPGFYTVTGLVYKYSLLLLNAYPSITEDISSEFTLNEEVVSNDSDDMDGLTMQNLRTLREEEQYLRFNGFNISEDAFGNEGIATDGLQYTPSSLENQGYRITKTDNSATNVRLYMGSNPEYVGSIEVEIGSSGGNATEPFSSTALSNTEQFGNQLYVPNRTRVSGARINVNVHMDADNNSLFEYKLDAWLPNFGRHPERDPVNNPTRYLIRITAAPPVYDEDDNPTLITDWGNSVNSDNFVVGTNSWETHTGQFYAREQYIRIHVDVRQLDQTKDYLPELDISTLPEAVQDLFQPIVDGYGAPPWKFYIKNLEMNFQNNSDLLFPLEWEKFKSNFIVNPKPNYDSPLYEKNNFLLIGGLSKDSFHFKTLASLVGYDFESLLPRENFNFEKYNPYDVVTALDTLAKYDSSLYNEYLNPYVEEVYSYGELIHNGIVDTKWHGTFENTELKQTDIGAVKIFKGVKPMWQQLGFSNDGFDKPDEDFYWKNIHKDGLEERDGIIQRDLPDPTKGALTPRIPRKEYIVDEEASQAWNSNAYWPNLPKFNKLGVLSDVYPPGKDSNFSYGSDNSSIESIQDSNSDLLFELNFEDEITDNTENSQVKLNRDFKLIIDKNGRMSVEAKDYSDVIETKRGMPY